MLNFTRDRSFRDDGGTPMWRMRNLNWYERNHPAKVFVVLALWLALLLIGLPGFILLLCSAFVR